MDYYTLDWEIASIERKIHLLSALKPINLRSEQMRFFYNPNRNPQFRYRPLSFSAESLLRRLQHLKSDRTPLGMIFREKIEELKQKIELLQAIGTFRFMKISEKLYGSADSDLFQRAHQKLKYPFLKKRNPKHHAFSAEETKKIFERLFQEYGLLHWKVRMKDNLVSDCVSGKRNVLFLRTAAKFSRQRISRLIAHEIETHLFTAENGKLQPYRIFNRGLARYLETQEGLAVYAQEVKQEVPVAIQSWSALSIIAVAAAMEGDFCSVYGKLLKLGLSQKRAFRMATRVKRGFTDTTQPGAFTKEIIYFTGAQKIEQFVKKGGDLKKLFIGKVALQDLPFIQKIPKLAPPKYLPQWLLGKTIAAGSP